MFANDKVAQRNPRDVRYLGRQWKKREVEVLMIRESEPSLLRSDFLVLFLHLALDKENTGER